MQNEILASLARLSDVTLISQIKTLVGRERDVTAEIVAHIAELDTRDVHLREGYPSLFLYCRAVFGLSEWEAYNRIEVARTVRRFPIILGMLADGSVHLTAVRRLAPHLTIANHKDALESARGKTKAEIEEIAARLSPRPDVAASVRRLPHTAVPVLKTPGLCDALMEMPAEQAERGGARHDVGAPADPRSGDPLLADDDPQHAAVRPSGPAAPPVITPLSPDRYKLQLTISGATLEKLRLVQDMLGHVVASGAEAEVLDRALSVLLADLAKRKFADAARPRRVEGRKRCDGANGAIRKAGPRNPSAAVKRAVWLRDLGRCAFVGSSGHRCNERRSVEFHHVDPYALGGEATLDGIQLRCRRHNDYEGRLYFGKRRASRELVPEQVRLSTSHSR
jgi:hypothetical protein